jgi:hypothetical protein
MRILALVAVAVLACGQRAPITATPAGDAGESCSSEPRRVALVEGPWDSMAVDDSYIYVANRQVGRIPKRGGELEIIAGSPDAPMFQPAHADGTHLYWVEASAPSEYIVLRAPRNDPFAVHEVGRLPISSDAFALAVDAGPFVFWTDADGRLGRLSKFGGGGAVMAETGEYDDDDYNPLLALDQHSVFWLGGEAGQRASDDDPVGIFERCK